MVGERKPEAEKDAVKHSTIARYVGFLHISVFSSRSLFIPPQRLVITGHACDSLVVLTYGSLENIVAIRDLATVLLTCESSPVRMHFLWSACSASLNHLLTIHDAVLQSN